MKKYVNVTTILALAAICLAIGVAWLALHEPAQSLEWKRKAAAYDERCGLLAVALESQRLELATVAHRQAVVRRMRDELPYWRPNDAWMCTGTTVDLRRRSECVANEDYDCLISLSRDLEAAIRSWWK